MSKSLSSAIQNVIASHVRLFDGNNRGPVDVARINGSFGLTVVDIGFSQLEEGTLLSVYQKFPALADAGNADILIRTSADVNVICTFNVVGQARAESFLYEAPTVSATGTALTPRSRNRQKASDVSVGASFFSGPTVSAVGTELIETRIPGAGRQRAIGGFSDGIAQWVLARDTDYLFRLTNDSGGAEDYTIGIGFFETFVK